MLSKILILFAIMAFLTITSTNLVSATDLTAKEIEDINAKAAATFERPSAESWRRCETSDASPAYWDIYWAVQGLHTRGGMCCNYAIRRNECTNIIAHGSADIGFCGVQRCIPCAQLGAEVWYVALECQRGGRAGGIGYLDSTSYIVVY